MAWNPSPEVSLARDAAHKLGAKQCFILWITDEGRYGMASYGRTKALCAEAGKIGDIMHRRLGQELLMLQGDA